MKRPNVEKRPDGTKRIRTLNTDPTKRAQQHFKDQVNINNIIRRYKKTGQLPILNDRKGMYMDVTSAQGYFESLTKVAQANQAFEALPSHLRLRFNNDPGALLDFIHNPNNFEEGVKLGIFDPKQPKMDGSSPAPKPHPHSYDSRTKKSQELHDDDSNDDVPSPKKPK